MMVRVEEMSYSVRSIKQTPVQLSDQKNQQCLELQMDSSKTILKDLLKTSSGSFLIMRLSMKVLHFESTKLAQNEIVVISLTALL